MQQLRAHLGKEPRHQYLGELLLYGVPYLQPMHLQHTAPVYLHA